jgi:hypothetical protein
MQSARCLRGRPLSVRRPTLRASCNNLISSENSEVSSVPVAVAVISSPRRTAGPKQLKEALPLQAVAYGKGYSYPVIVITACFIEAGPVDGSHHA